ncbi:Toxin ParE1 [Leminorella richardii]|uniref:Toxin n=1 Tax=Leminorella richardii TaxID=158841 RepID=A0A2X4USD3_9GAMM|nr:type II toxin-antitoxin system RelE/ParE family toxin [Leminorella richardii]SQI41731.1 Toxin ParE1 [Leminorella richardii]
MYKLSHLAAIDFASIYEYTLTAFGAAQADDYTNALENILGSIVQSPFIGRAYPDIHQEIRRVDYRHHAIFYRIRKNDVFVLRILHQQMEPLIHFSAEE